MDLEDHCIMPGSGSPAATLVGRFLVAAPSMPDERFQKSVVFICKHDDDGALGIIVNNKVDDLPLGQVYKQLGIEVSEVAASAAGAVRRSGRPDARPGAALGRLQARRNPADRGRHGTHRLGRDPEGHGRRQRSQGGLAGAGPFRLGSRASSTSRCRTMPGWWSTAIPHWCSTPTWPPSGSAPSIAWAAGAASAAGSTRRHSRISPAAPDPAACRIGASGTARSLMSDCNSRWWRGSSSDGCQMCILRPLIVLTFRRSNGL